MSARKIRRVAAHAARKAARKAGFPIPLPASSEAISSSEPVAPSTPITNNAEPAEVSSAIEQPPVPPKIPETGYPYPSLSEITPARLAANKANARLSKGPLSQATKAISAQNHTLHGLARHHDGNFKILTSENAAAFDSLKQALIAEHQPSTETESILVNGMAESHWLETRAHRLQDTCLDSATGAIVDEKKFSLYMRYKTTHTRAFHKCLHDILKLRSEKRKAELGVEAHRIKNEAHEMKKQSHYWHVLGKDVSVSCQMAFNAVHNIKAQEENPTFKAQYAAELAKRGLKENTWDCASQAA